MRFVLIGGGGFIGLNLANFILNHINHEVVIIGRKDSSSLPLPSNCIYARGNFEEADFLKSVIRQDDYVVHLAYNSIPQTSYDNPLKDIQENLESAVNLFTILSTLNIKKLLYISSGGTVYGNTTNFPIDETHSTNPMSPYGITKLTIEKYASLFSKTKNLPVVIARPSNPYGFLQKQFSGQGFIATAIGSILQNKQINIFGQEGTVRDYIFIDDVVRALYVLLISDCQNAEIFNVGSGIGVNNVEIISILRELLPDYKVDVNHLPPRKFDVLYNVLNCSKIQALGWNTTTDLYDGIKQTIRLYL